MKTTPEQRKILQKFGMIKVFSGLLIEALEMKGLKPSKETYDVIEKLEQLNEKFNIKEAGSDTFFTEIENKILYVFNTYYDL